jgi:5-methylthioadenosine/S-adenosylhomocysteine deaminase
MPDILIKNGYIITMNTKRRVIPRGAVVIEDDEIVAVGKTADIEKDYRARKVIDAKNMVVLPGFIDAHIHVYQNFLKGSSDDLPLEPWIEEVLVPFGELMVEDYQFGKYDIGYYSMLISGLEMIKSGTTTFASIDTLHKRMAAGIEETGLRGFYGIQVTDANLPSYAFSSEVQWKGVADITREWHNKAKGRVKCMIAPTWIPICSEKCYRRSRSFAEDHGLRLHTHIGETKAEADYTEKNFGKRPVEYLHEIGFLGPDLHAAHCIWLDDQDLDIMAEHDVKIAHNPESNMKLASGVMPLKKMLERKLTIGLAADGCASNDNLDMFEQMRGAAYIQKLANLDAACMSAERALEMATINGAKVLGAEGEIGSIEVGKKADIVLVDMMKPHLQPVNHIAMNLVYAAWGSDIDTTIVNGEILMDRRRLKTLDEKKILRRCLALDLRIKKRMRELRVDHPLSKEYSK